MTTSKSCGWNTIALLSLLLLLFSSVVNCQQQHSSKQDNNDSSSSSCSSNNDSSDDSSSNTALQKIRLGLEWFVNPDHLPLIVAQEHGIFKEFGLDVELVEPKDHWEAEEEILQGRLDVAVTEPLHLAQDAALGKPVLGFSRFLHTDGGVLYDSSSGIHRPADMCGKTISYPGSPGPGGPAIVNTMVKVSSKMPRVATYDTCQQTQISK